MSTSPEPDGVLALTWAIQMALQAASTGDYSKRCPVSITQTFAVNPLTMITPSINLLLDDLQAKERAQQRAEAQLHDAVEELENKVQTIERQASDIRRLSTPLIEVWEDILIMPIIGVIDPERGEVIMESMLSTISRRQARCVILDVTGVDSMDTAAADQLLHVVRTGRLLGAYCVLTGMRPEVAQALTSLGIELSNLVTLRTVKDGLRQCMRYRLGS